MKFPEERTAQYAVTGYILAETAERLGCDMPDAVYESWAATMSRLGSADDVSESDNNVFNTADSLLDYLGLDPNPQLVEVADELLVANELSFAADSVSKYFASRKREAETSAGLLQFSSPKAVAENEPVWKQMRALSVFGVYFDSYLDAPADVAQLPQFRPAQLRRSAVVHMARVSSEITPKAWFAIGKASHHYGMGGYMLRRLLGSQSSSANLANASS